MSKLISKIVSRLYDVVDQADGSFVGRSDPKTIVIVRPLKYAEPICTLTTSVSHYLLKLRYGILTVDVDGELVGDTYYSKDACRRVMLAETEDVREMMFVPTVEIEYRSTKEHAALKAVSAFGDEMSARLIAFYHTHSDEIEAERKLNFQNQYLQKMITVREDSISILVPRKDYDYFHWDGRFVVDFNTGKWDFVLIDLEHNEEMSIIDVYDSLLLEKTHAAIEAFIANNALPRNDNGLMY